MNAILDFFFPRRCPVCDGVLSVKGEKICPECRAIPKLVIAPRCVTCGKHIENAQEEKCYDCKKGRHFFDSGISLYEYNSMHDSIYAFKNKERAEYASFYGEEIAKYLSEEIRKMKADVLIPIPLHRSKLEKRGYNQAELLAKEIGRQLNIPVNCNFIKRVKKTKEQKTLTGAARQNNLKKAFHISENDVKLKSIILVDDVYTTGNTIDTVAAEFRSRGVEKIYFITLAIGKGK